MIFAALVALVLSIAAIAADEVLSWQDAGKHVGEETTVEGQIVAVHCSQLSCLLAFEPSFNRFTAVIQARSFDAFPPAELETRYKGKRVQVRGKIEERDGKPEIVVEKPQQIALARDRRRTEREAAQKATEANAETVERMGEVLGRIEELTERLAGIQERMDAILAQLEERDAALASAQANQPPPPPPPSNGEAQPRPGFESLRTLKRGMSRSDVERLIGEPQYVDNSTGGWSTWYYGYGRSVSFNSRGRVDAMIGFPAP